MRRALANPAAFTQIYDRHSRVVGAYLARRLGPSEAEDILSETFLVAFRRRSSFDASQDSARPWLLGIATRLIKRHRAVEARYWAAVQLGAADAATQSDSSVERAAERADAAQAVRELWPTVSKLSSNDRETLMLFALADLTYEEVARSLNIPVGTVRSRLNRVRRRLTQARELLDVKTSAHKEGLVDGRYRTSA